MTGAQASLTQSAADARQREDTGALDAWFADDLPDVEQALAFAEFVVPGMEAQHFTDYDAGSAFVQAFEELYHTGPSRFVGQTDLAGWV